MQNIIKLPQEVYNSSLKEIHGIAFSAREIEVIGAILLEIPTQQMPDNLSITEESAQESMIFGYKVSERTVASHIDKIYEKLSPLREEHKDALRNRITKRDKIKYVIQNSKVNKAFEEYCRALKIENAFLNQLEKIFRKQLHDIQTQIDKKQAIIGQCQIYYRKENSHSNLPLYISFARHLNDRKNKNESKIITTTLKEGNLVEGDKSPINYLFYIIPEEARTYLNLKESKIINFISDLEVKASVDSCKIIFLLDSWKDKKQIPELVERLSYIHLGRQGNYYESFFEVLKKMFPKLCIDDEIKTFKKFCLSLDPQDSPYSRRKILITVCLLCLGIFSTGLWKYINWRNQEPIIRSDLIIPSESSLIHRPELMAQINNKLKNQDGIQAVALIGPAGAGKTTLSRQYAHQQKASVIWEINAETQEGLRLSFENLAQNLAKTEEDKNALREIQEIKDLEVKERKIIQFVKDHLWAQPNWFLAFDNVEKFSDIQKYFPQDFGTWGQGKIILTTRNNNIENNKYINEIVQIGELTPDQKTKLFIKIISHGNEAFFSPSQIEESKIFLEHIPSFPLDVSVAAYYLKTTRIPYSTYLENLTKYNKEFENVQESLLKEAGDYTKTRYKIISLSLEYVMHTHKDFRDLLLFISLLDSQNIPRDLIEKYKDKRVIDNFLYNLNKYSLIIQSPQFSSNKVLTFSIHRSVQAIALAYFYESLLPKTRQYSIQDINEVFENYLHDFLEKENLIAMNSLLPHIITFLKHDHFLTEKIKGSLGSKLGGIYYFLGYHTKAKKLLETSLTILNKPSSMQNGNLSLLLIYLGNVCRELGDYERAKSSLERSLQLYKQQSLKYPLGTARALGDLGILYRNLGDYEKAKNCLEESFQIYKKHHSDHHSGAILVLSYLGIVYWDMGDYQKARKLLEISLLAYKKYFPENVGKIGWVLTYLGSVYREKGDFEKAKILLEEALQIYKKHFFKNHVGIARAATYLGDVYRELGNYDKAKHALEQSFFIYTNYFPENKVGIGWSSAYLGMVYRDLGDYSKAKKLFDNSLKIHKELFGNDNTKTAWALVHSGNLYRELGHHRQARDLLEISYAIYKRKFKEKHNMALAWVSIYLGNVYKDLGDYQKAINCLQQSLAAYVVNYGRDHLKITPILRSLGQVYLLKNQIQISENYFRDALRIFQKDNHPDTYKVFEDFAELYQKEAFLTAHKNNTRLSKHLKNRSINELKQALEIVRTHFSKDSLHIARIEAKLKKLEGESL